MLPDMTTIAPTPSYVPPPNGNPGIVPPWLQNDWHILPMPPGWEPAMPISVTPVGVIASVGRTGR